jgi:hypothetical protein
MSRRNYDWNERAEALHRSEDSLVRARVRRRRLRAVAVAVLVVIACVAFAWALAHTLAEGELREAPPTWPATCRSSALIRATSTPASALGARVSRAHPSSRKLATGRK